MLARTVRPPVCADDRWYPHDRADLENVIDEFLARVPDESVGGQLIGLIAPHAGYAFSGQTAAYAYKQLSRLHYDRVVVIGPSHYEGLGAQAVNRSGFYETPLGEIPVDAEALAELNGRLGINFVLRDHEHSLEMQLPFLQRQLGTFKLVPIMMSHPFYAYGLPARNDAENLSEALTHIMDDKTLLVASSDLSHLHDYESVTYYDQGLQNLIEEYDIPGLIDYMVNEGECRACGDVGIITLLMASKTRGADRVRVLSRTNSGDVTGIQVPGQYTVGYMAAAVYRAADAVDR